METIFVDTAALIALGNISDSYHEQAKKIYAELLQERVNFITTNAVILETANAFSKAKFKPCFLNILNMVKNSSYWEYVIIDDMVMNNGIDLFKTRSDKDWGLVDCIGINISKSRHIQRIFTADKHFKQAGFQILLS